MCNIGKRESEYDSLRWSYYFITQPKIELESVTMKDYDGSELPML